MNIKEKKALMKFLGYSVFSEEDFLIECNKLYKEIKDYHYQNFSWENNDDYQGGNKYLISIIYKIVEMSI